MSEKNNSKPQNPPKISLFTKIFLLLVHALFTWAVWQAFLSSFVPRQRTLFWDYDSFRNKAKNSGLALQLPESAHRTKYYWGVNWFVTVSGYGTALSDEDYEDIKSEAIKRYQEAYDGHSGVNLYLYSESVEKAWVQEDWLEQYNIEETKKLLGKDDKISNYYVLSYEYTDSDHITYFTCMLCNDSSKRIIEVSCIDRNAGKPITSPSHEPHSPST